MNVIEKFGTVNVDYVPETVQIAAYLLAYLFIYFVFIFIEQAIQKYTSLKMVI